jgi:hypothetical protein
MRTFPRELADFRSIVDARGASLRELPYEALQRAHGQTEELHVQSRPAAITTIVTQMAEGALQVVIRGALDHRFIMGESVALDGFYKSRDGSVTNMSEKELYGWD